MFVSFGLPVSPAGGRCLSSEQCSAVPKSCLHLTPWPVPWASPRCGHCHGQVLPLHPLLRTPPTTTCPCPAGETRLSSARGTFGVCHGGGGAAAALPPQRHVGRSCPELFIAAESRVQVRAQPAIGLEARVLCAEVCRGGCPRPSALQEEEGACDVHTCLKRKQEFLARASFLTLRFKHLLFYLGFGKTVCGF